MKNGYLEATDLMIGDIVMYDHNVFEEDEYMMGQHPLEPHKIESGESIDLAIEGCFSPLPITPEILEKNGLKRKFTCNCYISVVNDKTISVDVPESLKSQSCTLWIGDCFGGTILHIQISYVHELQRVLRSCGLWDLADNFMVDVKEQDKLTYSTQKPVTPYMEAKPMVYTSEQLEEILFRGAYGGFEFMIISFGNHPCAYVKIPIGHQLFNKDYTDINIDCHGGLTFSSSFPVNRDSDSVNYWIGWDYVHCGDYEGRMESVGVTSNIKRWTTEEIIKECESVIDQIKSKYK